MPFYAKQRLRRISLTAPSNVLMAFVALHIAGALANHFWFKTDVLRRILPGQGRKT